MNDPVQKWWSEQQIKDAAMEFMRCDFPLPDRNDAAARDRWHERLGLLVTFTAWLWDTYTPERS